VGAVLRLRVVDEVLGDGEEPLRRHPFVVPAAVRGEGEEWGRSIKLTDLSEAAEGGRDLAD
jgi:hypothetical protein